jgi:uncharacterized DUF497 family protein
MLFERKRRDKEQSRQTRCITEEAASVFLDPLALTFSDADHSAEEEREITVGLVFDRGSY